METATDMQAFLEFKQFKKALGGMAASGNGVAVGAENGGPALALIPPVSGAVANLGSQAVETGEENSDEPASGVQAVTNSPFDDLVTRDELAHILGISGKTVDRMAEDHRLPPGVDIGHKVWSKQRTYAWIINCMEKAEDEALADMARLKL